MRKTLLLALIMVLAASMAQAAYHHMGEKDSDEFTAAYPQAANTKLDSCALCHQGGQFTNKKGRVIKMGSCQWCHDVYGYDESGDITQTMNAYGLDYLDAGRDAAAIEAIDPVDSDGDGYTNQEEIAARTYPGDTDDDPSKTPAPYRVYSMDLLKTLPSHTQFMVMNTHKSGDYYTRYTGVRMDKLLEAAGMRDAATGVTAFAPDGWATYHPLDPNPGMYHVRGEYQSALYHYAAEADVAVSDVGWCDYSSPFAAGRQNGDPIQVDGGLRMILAYLKDGQPLTPGRLDQENRLDGDGPFRVVPPQVVPGPPDQASTSSHQNVIWPFNPDWDHNAGFATRSATVLRVEPLPAGTTDIDVFEIGWDLVDNAEIIVYGALEKDEKTPTATPKTVGAGGLVTPQNARRIAFAFDEDMQAGTFNQNTFLLAQVTTDSVRGDKPIQGSVSYDAASRTAAFTPDQQLAVNREYRVTLTTGVRDIAGNPLAQEVTYTFQTVPPEEEPGGGGSSGCFINITRPAVE